MYERAKTNTFYSLRCPKVDGKHDFALAVNMAD